MQLHNHTCYSLLDSIVNPKDLPKWAKENNYSAIGVSEHGNIHSQIIFYKECIKNNIKPILGVEAYVTDDITIKDKDSRYDHLLIIVKNIDLIMIQNYPVNTTWTSLTGQVPPL